MEYNKPRENNFKAQLLKNIETNNVKAYPKAYFMLRVFLLVVVAILILLVSVCIFSYICFNLHASGRGSLLGFGLPGIVPFLHFFPWTHLVLDVILVGVLVWLLRNFRFGYRLPVLYLLLIFLVATGLIGYTLYRTGFNEMLLQQAYQNHLPFPMGYLYENASLPPKSQGMCECNITAINGNNITAYDSNASSTTPLTIIVPSDYPELSSLNVGESIFVAGVRTASHTIQAYGVSPLPPRGL